MQNPFSLSDDQLIILLNAYATWSESNEKEREYSDNQQEKSKELKETLLNKNYLSKLSDEELSNEVFKYSRTLEGPAHIRLGKPRISGEIVNIKRNLLYLIDSSHDPFRKAGEILEKDYKIPIFAKAFWTPLFQAQYPKKLPNWNNKTENFFEKVGIKLKTSKLSVEEKYRLISDAFKYLQNLDPEQNFHNINHLMHYGTVIQEGAELIENLLKNENGNGPNPECPFSAKTFDLLRGLHKNPTRDYYNKNKDDFKIHLENPFQDIFRKVAEKFTPQMIDYLEVNKGLFSRILKNDWGKGGAWDFYWGAFYPKGGKRIEDAQLFIWMNQNIFEFGFYIGEYGIEQRQRFLSNCKTNQASLENILADSLSDERFIFGQWQRQLEGGAAPEYLKDLTWQEWLAGPGGKGIHVAVFLTENDVLALSEQELVEQIYDIFRKLFPLVILTICENPLPIIGNYIIDDDLETREKNPYYHLSQCATDTGFQEAMLNRWVRAIERKGQAIVYGPPGTGKTFIAEHLARHLIGGGDGFRDLVQFHPGYAYEDFVQGIRPKAKADGGLDYPIVSGRFLEFCEKARSCQDSCVLIIDEINRANLARVFGELMYLLEYRDQEVPLSSGGFLRIPKNVRIIGTMNTADRSIALVDHALRRRFAFLALYPNYAVLKQYHNDTDFNIEPLINVLIKLNKQIGDLHYEVGITFFLRKDLYDQIEDIWRMEIEPYLEEYFFDQPDKTDAFRWEKVGKEILS